MCFIWNKSGEIENGDHKVEYHRGIWTGMYKIKHVVLSEVEPRCNR